MSDIFISYAREDRPRVEHLAAALEQCGWAVWLHQSIVSPWVQDEAQVG